MLEHTVVAQAVAQVGRAVVPESDLSRFDQPLHRSSKLHTVLGCTLDMPLLLVPKGQQTLVRRASERSGSES